MNNAELLKNARNLLLKLHKSLVDHERAIYEGIHGPLNATQFLNVLLEDQDFNWLRRFSMLIVEIDEMFDLKDSIPQDLIEANLIKIRELVGMAPLDEDFKAKYQASLQQDIDAASLHSQLRGLVIEN